ncbi:MAG: hypothetical protein CVV64_13900 [Candidatus Wallbacteria bacterium HGW-Wallbacteria-1]|jgi:acyl-coenzyme A synthetase/AMP-(fatty) acid ligase|uniref:AMP-dependent synthetase/ligase domain-containing protein n=1 Tax=Candidatus Wallbacteria bacterium HGW-Wallbacteria-1 TaxID=2013854 RepID=A0A2N1PMI4_9BACT|nr:MAG: hypothetical protein CVV64_13900 [Candidatus Wallbacteria bacterium HGW-Wallbacteria-1]
MVVVKFIEGLLFRLGSLNTTLICGNENAAGQEILEKAMNRADQLFERSDTASAMLTVNLGTGPWNPEAIISLTAAMVLASRGNQVIVRALDHRLSISDDELTSLTADIQSGPHTALPSILLALATSGTTGNPRIAIHDLNHLMGAAWKTESDSDNSLLCVYGRSHMAGQDIILRSLFAGRPVILMADPDPRIAPEWIEKFKPTILPCTPSFLRLMIHSGCCAHRDLSSVKTVVYGAEALAEALAEKIHQVFPNAKLVQTYGLTEAGVTDIENDPERVGWFRFRGRRGGMKVIDGIINIQSPSLKRILEFDENWKKVEIQDGWFSTGDQVEIHGPWMKVTKRSGRMINVGGVKIRPEDIENLLASLPWISAVRVSAAPSNILGSMVSLDVELMPDSDYDLNTGAATQFIRKLCLNSLDRYHVPQKIEFHPLGSLMGDRLKAAAPSNTGRLTNG